MDDRLDRRGFLALSALALAGCVSRRGSSESPGAGEFHVFSKMFQPPVVKDAEALCALMAGAGYDGIQWTVRPKGHVDPARAAVDLPRVCRAAEKAGLRNRTICTAILPGDPNAETVLKAAADCGVGQFRMGYFLYDVKTETFRQSMDRIHRGFAELAKLAEKTGVKAVYQNHSSWGPNLFGGVIWDVHECVRDLDPQYIGIEYDPMHAFYETNLSWTHGFDLVAPWIAAIDLKDFHWKAHAKNPKLPAKAMVAAGEGVVPWKTVKTLQECNGVKVPYILHFEYKFDQTNLARTVKDELDFFKGIFRG